MPQDIPNDIPPGNPDIVPGTQPIDHCNWCGTDYPSSFAVSDDDLAVITWGGQTVFSSRISRQIHTCDGCGDPFVAGARPLARTTNEGYLCEDCRDDREGGWARCSDCGHWDYRDVLSLTANDRAVCVSCRANYGMCCQCEDVLPEQQLTEYGENTYCADCLPDDYCDTSTARHEDFAAMGFYARPPAIDTPIGNHREVWPITVGCELEIIWAKNRVRGRHFMASHPEWGIAYDGSLTRGGAELRSPIYSGPDGLQELRQVVAELADYGIPRVNKSCGFHVHLGNWPGFRAACRFIYLWQGLQEWALTVVSPSRQRNEYCKPTKYSRAEIRRLTSESQLQGIGESDRYRALNLQSWYAHQTLEIRLHQGTVDPNKIYWWCLLWCVAANWARDKVWQEIRPIRTASGLLRAAHGMLEEEEAEKMRRFYAERQSMFLHGRTAPQDDFNNTYAEDI